MAELVIEPEELGLRRTRPGSSGLTISPTVLYVADNSPEFMLDWKLSVVLGDVFQTATLLTGNFPRFISQSIDAFS